MHNVVCAHYGFSAIPFSKEIACRDIFETQTYKQAYGMLSLGLGKEDIVLLSGEIGIGKSIVIRSFLHSLDDSQFLPLYIRGPHLSSAELYKSILAGLHIAPPYTKSASKMMFFKKIPDLKKKPVVVIDDAQEMAESSFIELKSLINFDQDSRNQLTIVLCGQPELLRRIKMAHLDSLRQRIRLSVTMGPLLVDECARYIDHQIRIAGNQTVLFSEAAKADIFKKTGGIPRKINSICYNTLLQGAVKKLPVIDSADVCVPDLLDD
jgi:general secretion pathway protein A